MDNKNATADAIQVGRIEVASDAKGILTLKRRTQIWETMLNSWGRSKFYYQLMYLQINSVHHVHTIWDRSFPEDPGVLKMLELAQLVMEEKVDSEWAINSAFKFTQKLDTTIPQNITYSPALFVADAAAGTVVLAAHRDMTDIVTDPIDDDDELAPEGFYPSYQCASAAAGGMNWMPVDQVNVEARRAFWMWYLDEAIPASLRN